MAIFVLVVSIVTTYMFKVQQWGRGGGQLFSMSIFRELQSVTWPDLENKSFAKKKKEEKYEFTILLIVLFQSCSSSLM